MEVARSESSISIEEDNEPVLDRAKFAERSHFFLKVYGTIALQYSALIVICMLEFLNDSFRQVLLDNTLSGILCILFHLSTYISRIFWYKKYPLNITLLTIGSLFATWFLAVIFSGHELLVVVCSVLIPLGFAVIVTMASFFIPIKINKQFGLVAMVILATAAVAAVTSLITCHENIKIAPFVFSSITAISLYTYYFFKSILIVRGYTSQSDWVLSNLDLCTLLYALIAFTLLIFDKILQ